MKLSNYINCKQLLTGLFISIVETCVDNATRDGLNHQISVILKSKSPHLGDLQIKIIHVNDLKIKKHLNNEVIVNYFQNHFKNHFYNVQGFLLGNYLKKKNQVYSYTIFIIWSCTNIHNLIMH